MGAQGDLIMVNEPTASKGPKADQQLHILNCTTVKLASYLGCCCIEMDFKVHFMLQFTRLYTVTSLEDEISDKLGRPACSNR